MCLISLADLYVGKRYPDSKVPQRFRLQAANSTETLGSKDGARASSDVGGWGPERSRASQAESEMGSIVSAPDMYPEDSGLIEEIVVSVLRSLMLYQMSFVWEDHSLVSLLVSSSLQWTKNRFSVVVLPICQGQIWGLSPIILSSPFEANYYFNDCHISIL